MNKHLITDGKGSGLMLKNYFGLNHLKRVVYIPFWGNKTFSGHVERVVLGAEASRLARASLARSSGAVNLLALSMSYFFVK